MRVPLVVAALLVLAAPPASFAAPPAKTPPATWDAKGWRDFRWGMGVDDVEQVLRADLNIPHEQFSRDMSKERHPEIQYFVAGLGTLTIADQPTVPGFWFGPTGLYEVSLALELDRRAMTDADATDWYFKVKRLLLDKYGKPSRVEEPKGKATVADLKVGNVRLVSEWRTGVNLACFGNRSEVTCAVRYFDPARRRVVEDLLTTAQAREDAKNREKL